MGSFGKNTITIDFAREKLGKRGKMMTEKQIEDILVLLRILSNKVIDSTIKL